MEEDPAYNAEVFTSSEETGEKPPGETKRTALDRLKASLRWVAVLSGALLLLLMARRILSTRGLSIRSWYAERKRSRANAEITYFRRFRRASLSNDARASLRELMFWLDRTNTQAVAPTLEQFARENGMPGLVEEKSALNVLLFGRNKGAGPKATEGKWSGKLFCQFVTQARKMQIFFCVCRCDGNDRFCPRLVNLGKLVEEHERELIVFIGDLDHVTIHRIENWGDID